MRCPASRAIGRQLSAEVRNPIFNFYRCQEGYWIQLVMIESERFWPGFCLALALEDVSRDSRLDGHARRAEHCRELILILDKRFAAEPREHWSRRLDTEGCI